jgi:hypothetical protein
MEARAQRPPVAERPSLRAGRLVLALWLGALAGCGGGSGAPDAAPAPDVTLDAAPECAGDDDCEDGLACNGLATCSAGRCVAGAPLRCDDGLACTTDFCSEELRRCVNRALDADGDGIAAASCLDARGVPLGADCDDASAGVYPGAPEVCDPAGVDEDCDPATHGGRDGDGDGFEDAACCNGSGPGACGTDCNDAVRGAHPDATEVCNGIDDDCDGMIDEGVLVTVYRDADGDGRGDRATPMTACETTSGFSPTADDCDDTSSLRSPLLPEICDGVDNDCDGTADPADAPVVATWYADEDGDGFGGRARTETSCARPAGAWSLLGTDCDDTSASRHPAQAERCNGVDDDCNGVADFSIAPGDLEDDDLDGRPDARCTPRPVPEISDCDDRDASTSAGGTEVCDGRDNDCDASVDEDVATVAYFRDLDGDGYGSEASGTVLGCAPVAGYVARGGDCDDTRAARSPGVVEGCNGVDDDCDRAIDDGADAALCEAFPGFACAAGRCRPPAGCPPRRDDCDDIAANGCETDLDTDAANCGGCGRACVFPHVVRTVCVAGACEFDPRGDCEPGWADCVGGAADGCETRLGTASDCAGCGDTCAPMTSCDLMARACVPDPVMCTAPLADCDGLGGTCETDTSTSTAHCGGCDRPCVGGDALWGCGGGTCMVLGCTGGRLNCDGSHDNGCEVPPDDPTRCGTCTRNCLEPFTTASCTAGLCGAPFCLPGRYDCDADLGMGGSGCESATPCASVLWARAWGDTGDDRQPFGYEDVAVDGSGNVYVLTSFRTSLRVSGTTHMGPDMAHAGLLVSLDPAGDVRWAQVLAPSGVGDAYPERVVVNGSDVFVAGAVMGTGNLQLGATAVGPITNIPQGFVLRASASTGALAWGRIIGGADGVDVRALDVSAAGHVVFGGYFMATVDLGGGMTISGTDDGYVARVSVATGANVSLTHFGGPAFIAVQALDVRDFDGDVMVGGYYSDGSWTLGTTTLPEGGGMFQNDAWVARCTGALMCGQVLAFATPNDEAVLDVEAGPTDTWVFSGRYDDSTTIGAFFLSGAGTHGFLGAVGYVSGTLTWARGHEGAGTATEGIRRFQIDPSNRIHAVLSSAGGGTFASEALTLGTVVTPHLLLLDAGTTSGLAVIPLSVSQDMILNAIALHPADASNVLVGAVAGTTTIEGATMLSSAGGWDQVVLRRASP